MTALNWKKSFNMENQDLLVCDICTERYDNQSRKPKFLNCHHTFCEYCLLYVTEDQVNVECPTCRKVTRIGENGVQGLQCNFYVVHIMQSLDKLSAPKVKGCPKHSQQPMSFFCEKCAVTICRDCTVIDHKEGEGHNIKDVATAASEEREKLQAQMRSAKTIHKTLVSKFQQLEAEVENLHTIKTKAQSDIEEAFTSYHTILDRRKEIVLQNLNKMYAERQASLTDILDQMKEQEVTLSQSLVADENVPSGSLVDIVSRRAKLADLEKSITDSISCFKVGANYISFENLKGLEQFTSCVSELGKLTAEKTLPCKVDITNLPILTACLPAEITVQVLDFGCKALLDNPIEVKLSDPENDQLTTVCTKCTVSQDYKVKFTPQMSGKHKLWTTFHGAMLKGSEKEIDVISNNPIAVIGSSGQGNGKFKCPRAVVLDDRNNIYIADTGNKLMQKLDSDGQFQVQFSISGDNDEYSSCDLALDKQNSVIICTETLLASNMVPTMGNTVAVYNLDGSIKQKFCNKIMKCALCVATNNEGDIIISDYLVHSLFMYDKAGNFLRRICSHSVGFNHPAFICCDKSNNIIVSDTNNDTVHVFNKAGQFKYQFGESGSGKGQLRQPFGVATNNEDIVVVDSGNKRLQVFTKDGIFRCMIESHSDLLDQPRGVAMTDDGCIFVADRNNDCIKKFRYK